MSWRRCAISFHVLGDLFEFVISWPPRTIQLILTCLFFQIEYTIHRNNRGLGINIAGGKGSTPFTGNDEVLQLRCISKIWCKETEKNIYTCDWGQHSFGKSDSICTSSFIVFLVWLKIFVTYTRVLQKQISISMVVSILALHHSWTWNI